MRGSRGNRFVKLAANGIQLGERVSPATVSWVAQVLDEGVAAFH